MRPLPQRRAATRRTRLSTRQGDQKTAQSSGQDSPKVDKTLLLEGIYYGDSPGSLRGPRALYEQAKRQGYKNITQKDCVNYLLTQPVYTLYRPARRNYRRNQIVTYFCGEVVQIDIMDMQRYRKENDGYLYSLLTYDTYSKFLTSFPIQNRKPESVLAGLENLVQTLPFAIVNIYWDKEGSFLSRKVQSWLKQYRIGNYTTNSQVKAPGVERVIRTIRLAVQRHFEHTGTLRWIDYLPLFVSNYNNRKHSTTKQRPVDLVSDPMITVPHAHSPDVALSLPPIGSFVRLNRLRGIFEKEASGNWTREVFRVVRHKVTSSIPMIYVEDLRGEPVLGGLYPEEYQQVAWDPTKKEIDKVLKKRQRKGQPTERFVTYLGWPSNYAEWTSL